jgi:hypothetical protein
MSSNMMIGYDIYECFTMEHFRLRQRMTLTTKIYCSRLYIQLYPCAECTLQFEKNIFTTSVNYPAGNKCLLTL